MLVKVGQGNIRLKLRFATAATADNRAKISKERKLESKEIIARKSSQIFEYNKILLILWGFLVDKIAGWFKIH